MTPGAPTPTTSEEERHAVVKNFAPTAASLATFVISAFTAPLDGRTIDRVVLAALAGVVVAARRIGGRGTALAASTMGALGFDFFHVHPLRALHGQTLLVAFAGLALLAALSPSELSRGDR
jgi:K+-sensing histidine kinase KdpD